MSEKINERMIFLILGMLLGMTIVSICGLALYKSIKISKAPQRYKSEVPSGIKFGNGSMLYVASSLDRIFQDGKTLTKPNFGESVKISAAKNEYESFQVVIKNGPIALKSVTFVLPDLINEKKGTAIDRSYVTIRKVGYVPTRKPCYPVKYVGLWPDPLLPLEKTDIKPAVTQSFWVSVKIPEEAPAGNYQGFIIVNADGIEPQKIAVVLTVYDFTLPKESHLTTAFDFYGHLTRFRYPQAMNESQAAYDERIEDLNEKYIIEMLKYRMNPILNIDPLSQTELGKIDRYRWFGITHFAIGRKGGTFNNNWPGTDEEIEALLPLYRTYGEILKLNKMFDMHYIYTWDEGDIGNPRVAKICSMIHRAYPELRNMACYHGFWDPQQFPDWGKDIDIWTFQIDNFDESKMKRLKELNKEIWMYISGPGGYTTPNLAIDFDSMDYRIIPWLCWKYGIKGFLYWSVNFWDKVDPFENAANTDWEQNGNGLLFYPGQREPLVSLRMEIFRDGMEDYEYLVLLKDKIDLMEHTGKIAIEPELIERAKQLLTVEDPLAGSMDRFTKDAEILYEQRNKIAEMIEELGQQ